LENEVGSAPWVEKAEQEAAEDGQRDCSCGGFAGSPAAPKPRLVGAMVAQIDRRRQARRPICVAMA